MKPETEIRNLKRELKNARDKAAVELSKRSQRVTELEREVKDLRQQLGAERRDNSRLEEIANVYRKLVDRGES